MVTLTVNHYTLTEHPYSAYEFVDYTIPSDEDPGLYEAVVEDNHSKRIRYSANAGPGAKIQFVFQRAGNAKVYIDRNKKNIRVMSINVDEF